MTNFTLAKHPAMRLSVGASTTCGERVTEIVGASARVVLIFDPALKPLGLVDPVVGSMTDAGHAVETFGDLTSDPKESSVDAATRLAHEMESNCIVGLGGGSALDTSKVVAVLAQTSEPCAAYRLGQAQLPFRTTALISIPTTAGTGSETTGTSIISEEGGTKNWFWGPPLKPDLALMDPRLIVGLPAYWTFFTGMDALVHSIESRTNRYRYAENDPLAERGIVEAITHLERAVNEPGNLEARTGMMLAAAYGGLAIGNTGCAVAHNIGHALGSIAGIPHGRAVSLALLSTLEWTIEGNRPAFDRVGQLLGGQGAGDIGTVLHGLADRCGQSLKMSAEEKELVEAQRLAADMVAPANISMLQATARDALPEDVDALARWTVAA
ncbi:MAG: iron-containing alcohol dehydrogenase [Ahrensia sp.]|nr:iron-containing alcohol dehydrogenase [Ahrensia sp.]